MPSQRSRHFASVSSEKKSQLVAPITLGELSLVLHAYPRLDDIEEAAKRAVRELVGAGLVHQDGRFLAPTRAAIYFERLRG